MVGPVPVGINKFVLQAPAPAYVNIPNHDLIGVTVILVTCSFMDKEFVRIGYYVNNEYSEPYEEGTLPDPIEISKLFRNILADQPRVTRFAIDWTGGNAPVELEGVPGAEQGDPIVADDDAGIDLDDMGEGEEDEEEDDDEEDGDVDLVDDEAEDEADMSEDNMVIHAEDSMDVEMMQRQSAQAMQ